MLNLWWLQDMPDEPTVDDLALNRAHTALKNNTEAMLALREKAAARGIKMTFGDLMELRCAHIVNFLLGVETEARYAFEQAVLDDAMTSLNRGMEWHADQSKAQLYIPPSPTVGGKKMKDLADG